MVLLQEESVLAVLLEATAEDAALAPSSDRSELAAKDAHILLAAEAPKVEVLTKLAVQELRCQLLFGNQLT